MDNELAFLDKLTLLIVEDDRDNREALQSMAALDFGHVYVASDGCEGVELFLQYRPDVIITDIEMPCMTGLDMLEKIREYDKEALVLFTTAFSDTKRLLKAIDLSVDGYAIKPIVYHELLDRIKLKYKGVFQQDNTLQNLSKREYEVFIDIAKGVKPSDIAQKYELKPKTVGTYRRRILEKLQLNSNTELIKYALAHQLI